jgi:uncharacterized protein YndB with AHSA1/START domain
MPDIVLDLPIRAPLAEVLRAVSTPEGLDQWWTDRSEGTPTTGSPFRLCFGPEYDWRAVVRTFDAAGAFELEITEAEADWTGTRIGFSLSAVEGVTHVSFRHTGWSAVNEHYRVSCYCWAMYLRVLKRHLEAGEVIPYADRLDV